MIALSASGSIAQTDSSVPDEIGRPYPGDGPSRPFPGLSEIQTMVDLGFMYTQLQSDDMKNTYGGIPQVGAGISFATSDRARFFLSARYGIKSGDPYHDIDGIIDEDGVTVKTLPLMFGMKINASTRQDFRLYLGGAFQFAYTWENVTTGDSNDNPVDIDAYGISTGYYLFMGPEFPLGQGTDALGAEFGFGGSKGDVTSGTHSHGVDLTGFHFRVYYTFGI